MSESGGVASPKPFHPERYSCKSVTWRLRRSAASMIGKRDELGFPRNCAEPAVQPVLLGLLDALLGAGNEVPPHVPRRIQRLAAEQHGLERRLRPQARTHARVEHDQVHRGKVRAIELRLA